MPRYYFEIHDGDWGEVDTEGADHPTEKHAGEEAIGTLTHLAKDKLPSRDERDFTADVRDESGRLIVHGKLSFRGVWAK
ncbi:hypothetical protein HCU64_16040 [Methylobacterium sp. C25]|nr:hypothetical protein [Methylobacterium sp. C25]